MLASERALFISVGNKLRESSKMYQIKPITNNHYYVTMCHNGEPVKRIIWIFFKKHVIKQCCHFLLNKCKIFKMLIETLFLLLFEPDQSEIKENFHEIVNIHNGAIFKNGTLINYFFKILSNK